MNQANIAPEYRELHEWHCRCLEINEALLKSAGARYADSLWFPEMLRRYGSIATEIGALIIVLQQHVAKDPAIFAAWREVTGPKHNPGTITCPQCGCPAFIRGNKSIVPHYAPNAEKCPASETIWAGTPMESHPVGKCTRATLHDGPCNGLPRLDCARTPEPSPAGLPWTSVTDRMPPVLQLVEVLVGDHEDQEIQSAVWSEVSLSWLNPGGMPFFKFPVTHWRTLPKDAPGSPTAQQEAAPDSPASLILTEMVAFAERLRKQIEFRDREFRSMCRLLDEKDARIAKLKDEWCALRMELDNRSGGGK